MTSELYKKHRPKTLVGVVGQPVATSQLKAFLENESVPHTLLFTGPSGTGKTTLCRILATEMQCSKMDLCEVNAAATRGIDAVREIRDRMSLSPINGSVRVWIIDEAHKLSSDAQSAFLKMLEDTPKHVYFMLATTDPQKLLPTIRTRCTDIRLQPVPAENMTTLLKRVTKREKTKISSDVLDLIVEVSQGSARQALVLLNQVIGLDSDKERMAMLQSADVKEQSIQLCRLLLNKNTRWNEMAAFLKQVDEDVESLRYMVLGYMTSVLLGGRPSPRAYLAMVAFRDNFYDSKRAGLVAACYEVLET